MIYSFFTYFLEEMRRRGSQGKEMRRRGKKCAFYIVDFGGTEMAASGYNQKKKWTYTLCSFLLVYEKKIFHQHSYGFQNFMSSWGSWPKISKLRQIGDVKDF